MGREEAMIRVDMFGIYGEAFSGKDDRITSSGIRGTRRRRTAERQGTNTAVFSNSYSMRSKKPIRMYLTFCCRCWMTDILQIHREEKVDFSNTSDHYDLQCRGKSNRGSEETRGLLQKKIQQSDYKKMKQNVMDEVKMIFRPEFLNRIDEVIVFHALEKKDMKQIVTLLCKEFTARVKRQLNISLTIRDSAKDLIVEKGTDAKYGARPLRRAMQTELEDKLAEAILNGDIQSGDMVAVGVSKNSIKVERKETKK